MIGKRTALLMIFFMVSVMAKAAPPQWQLVPEESKLTFTATQNGAPVTGEFKKFTADIHFDSDKLNASSVKVIVDTTSLYDSYGELADTLKTTEWFDVKTYPQAVFISNEFVKIGDKTYQSKGRLTIRDKTFPVTLDLTQEEYTPKKARFMGSTTIKRTEFGVGQGEWASTQEVKDEVKIEFTVSAIMK
jgi:polyisoprenoid-binding protein YceI